MLDFATPKPVSNKTRCQRRARTARKAARALCVVLAGLIGAAFISDPSMVGQARTAFGTVLEYAQENIQVSEAGRRLLQTAPSITEQNLSETAVARADTTFLRP